MAKAYNPLEKAQICAEHRANKTRKDQYRSPWDVIHPGRKFADKLGVNPRTATEIVSDLKSYFETGSVPKRLKAAATHASDAGHAQD